MRSCGIPLSFVFIMSERTSAAAVKRCPASSLAIANGASDDAAKAKITDTRMYIAPSSGTRVRVGCQRAKRYNPLRRTAGGTAYQFTLNRHGLRGNLLRDEH